MKITFLAPGRDLSGGARVIATYADKLQGRGHHVTIAMPGERRRSLKERVRELAQGQWRGQQPSHYDGVSARIVQLDNFRPLLDSDVPDADVVIGTWWETVEWLTTLSSAKGAKLHFIQGYEAFDHMPKDRVEAVWKLDIPKIVIAKWLMDLGREKFFMHDLHLVSNSVDLEHFNAPPRAPQSQPTVGTLYHPMPTKGVSTALAAFELVKRRVPNVRLLMFGAYAPERALPENCEFHYRPSQAEIPALYSRCDVWLAASSQEGFNLPAIEAMACRCPLVSTSAGRPPEIIVNGVNGYIADTIQGLADGLQNVLLSPDWRRLSANARETVSRYTWDDAVERFEEVLFAVARRRQFRARRLSSS